MIDKHSLITLEWSKDYRVLVGDNAKAWLRIILSLCTIIATSIIIVRVKSQM
jgi:hypothetical protein